MYVYPCQGVTDNQIRDAIREGYCSYHEAREAAGVDIQCGKCACLVKRVIRETPSDLQSVQPVPVFGATAFVAA